MKFWLILGAVVALLAAFPYIRCLLKRLALVGKLKKLCRRRGYRLVGTHALWFLGGKRSARCDFYIEMPDDIIAVKLFGVSRRGVTLVFDDEGRYFIRQHIGFITHSGTMKTDRDGPRIPLPPFQFRYGFRDEWELKRPRAVLLVHPVCFEIRQIKEHRERILGVGESVGGATLYTLSRLIGELEVEL